MKSKLAFLLSYAASTLAYLGAALSILCGCESSRPIELTAQNTTRWAAFKKWERKQFRLLGITMDVPKERHREEETVQKPGFRIMGSKSISFGLHVASRGFLQETSRKISVIINKYTPQEFAEFLRGERGCLHPMEYTETPRLYPALITKRDEQGIHYRKDYKSPDGSVIMAIALNRTGAGYGHGTECDAEDDAAIRRILGSIRFAK